MAVLLHGRHSLQSPRPCVTLCLIFIHFSKHSPTNGWPSGKISKAFILPLAAPFLTLCACEPGWQTYEALFSLLKCPGAVSGHQENSPAFRARWFQGFSLLLVCFCFLTGAVTLTQQLHLANSSTRFLSVGRFYQDHTGKATNLKINILVKSSE